MWEGHDLTLFIESKKEKIKRLMRGVQRDYKALGPSKTGKKAIKKIAKKIKSKLRMD
mgnify:FL=1